MQLGATKGFGAMARALLGPGLQPEGLVVVTQRAKRAPGQTMF